MNIRIFQNFNPSSYINSFNKRKLPKSISNNMNRFDSNFMYSSSAIGKNNSPCINIYGVNSLDVSVSTNGVISLTKAGNSYPNIVLTKEGYSVLDKSSFKIQTTYDLLKKKAPVQPLQFDKNNNLTFLSNQRYSVSGPFGDLEFAAIDYEKSKFMVGPFVTDFPNVYNYPEERIVYSERLRHFLDAFFRKYSERDDSVDLYISRTSQDVINYLKGLGLDTSKPFTINNGDRLKVEKSGEIRNVDNEARTIKARNYKGMGYDENTIFLIQGKEYHLKSDGTLPLPVDYIHDRNQFKIIQPTNQ